MRPTRGVGLVLALAAALQLLSRTTGTAWLSLAGGACLALPVAALLLRPRLDALQVLPGAVRARAGEAVEQELVVRNTSRRPSPAVRLTDRTPGLSPVVVAVPALRPGAEVTTVLRRTAEVRGAGDPVVELVSTAPFGLVRARRVLSSGGPVVVAPRRVAAPALLAGGAGSGGSPRPVAGSGTEVLGLRPWRAGDGAAAVSARASARHGRPVVLERERETGPALVVLCSGAGRGPSWEAAVERSCALAEQAVRRAQPPVLVAAGVPSPGRPDLGAVLDWHARLDAAVPADAASLALAVRSAGRGGALVVLGEDDGAVRRACASAGVAVVGVG